jgi:transcriptional regulator with XRE-family HTH domain
MQVAPMGRIPTQVTGSGSPTVRRRELGALLRALRTDADMTIEQVAEQLLCSPSKISRMETGQRGTSQRDIRDLCAVYNVTDPAQREHLAKLAREGREQAWWQPYDLPGTLATYVGLEAEATFIGDYEPGIVTGLLQTPEYARAVHENGIPRLSEELIAQRVRVRLGRQEILTRRDPPAPRLWAIIDESVLYRVVGGAEVMKAQLKHIVRMAGLPNVTLQILPYAAGAHPALCSTFALMEFSGRVPKVVYSEGLVGQFYLQGPHDIERYERAFEFLRTVSLSVEESVGLLAELAAASNHTKQDRHRLST